VLKEFKRFLTRGNLVEIAVGLILALTFAAVIAAFTDVVMSLIVALFGGTSRFADLVWRVGSHRTPVPIGAFLNAVITFVIVAFILFLVVKAYDRFRHTPEAGPTEIELLTQIRDALTARPSED
jgi:large conductance mechanosensitive channel